MTQTHTAQKITSITITHDIRCKHRELQNVLIKVFFPRAAGQRHNPLLNVCCLLLLSSPVRRSLLPVGHQSVPILFLLVFSQNTKKSLGSFPLTTTCPYHLLQLIPYHSHLPILDCLNLPYRSNESHVLPSPDAGLPPRLFISAQS